jgi:DNA-binding beta-propeller fold protein YncE
LRKWGSRGSGDGQFSYPLGVAVDASGNVFVADSDNDRIQVFNSSGTFLSRWGFSGSGNGQFYSPSGVAVDASGNVFVADTDNSRIQKFAKGGSAPGAATLISPSGSISTSTPTYTWNALPTATWYYLWVSDSTASGKIQQWYPADQAGCSSGTGTCAITPSVTLAPGACQWWIQTRNSGGDGPWSSPCPSQ